MKQLEALCISAGLEYRATIEVINSEAMNEREKDLLGRRSSTEGRGLGYQGDMNEREKDVLGRRTLESSVVRSPVKPTDIFVENGTQYAMQRYVEKAVQNSVDNSVEKRLQRRPLLVRSRTRPNSPRSCLHSLPVGPSKTEG